ncbi:MAG: hypothetical protein R3C16_02775 [Hyphomonadaceae bacterium]
MAQLFLLIRANAERVRDVALLRLAAGFPDRLQHTLARQGLGMWWSILRHGLNVSPKAGEGEGASNDAFPHTQHAVGVENDG